MNQEFTQNQLIRFIYQETSTVESMVINEAIQEDIRVRRNHKKLYEGYKQLPKATFSPSDSAIQNILRYSKETAVQAH